MENVIPEVALKSKKEEFKKILYKVKKTKPEIYFRQVK